MKVCKKAMGICPRDGYSDQLCGNPYLVYDGFHHKDPGGV